MQFKTKFATFNIWITEDGRIMESHCGFSIGCFYTKPECIGFIEDSPSLKEIKNLLLNSLNSELLDVRNQIPN